MGDRSTEFRDSGAAVVRIERDAVTALEARIDEQFARACTFMLGCQGRIVVTGMGKSGHIGNKIAATLASTGSPAFFVHPGEASHGDLGMITANDVVLALSNSGETSEIVTIVPLIKRMGVPLISLTGRPWMWGEVLGRRLSPGRVRASETARRVAGRSMRDPRGVAWPRHVRRRSL